MDLPKDKIIPLCIHTIAVRKWKFSVKINVTRRRHAFDVKILVQQTLTKTREKIQQIWPGVTLYLLQSQNSGNTSFAIISQTNIVNNVADIFIAIERQWQMIKPKLGCDRHLIEQKTLLDTQRKEIILIRNTKGRILY